MNHVAEFQPPEKYVMLIRGLKPFLDLKSKELKYMYNCKEPPEQKANKLRYSARYNFFLITLTNFEKSFKGLEFGLERVFKQEKFVPVVRTLFVVKNAAKSLLSVFKYYKMTGSKSATTSTLIGY